MADFRILRQATWFKSCVLELPGQDVNRDAVLQRHTCEDGDRIEQAGGRAAMLGDFHEHLSWLAVRIEADRNIAFVVPWCITRDLGP